MRDARRTVDAVWTTILSVSADSEIESPDQHPCVLRRIATGDHQTNGIACKFFGAKRATNKVKSFLDLKLCEAVDQRPTIYNQSV
jgi:hypothetical protein